MNQKQAKRLRKGAAKASPVAEGGYVDKITGLIRVKDEEPKDMIKLYTRRYKKNTRRNLYRQLKKAFIRVPRNRRHQFVVGLLGGVR